MIWVGPELGARQQAVTVIQRLVTTDSSAQHSSNVSPQQYKVMLTNAPAQGGGALVVTAPWRHGQLYGYKPTDTFSPA